MSKSNKRDKMVMSDEQFKERVTYLVKTMGDLFRIARKMATVPSGGKLQFGEGSNAVTLDKIALNGLVTQLGKEFRQLVRVFRDNTGKKRRSRPAVKKTNAEKMKNSINNPSIVPDAFIALVQDGDWDGLGAHVLYQKDGRMLPVTSRSILMAAFPVYMEANGAKYIETETVVNKAGEAVTKDRVYYRITDELYPFIGDEVDELYQRESAKANARGMIESKSGKSMRLAFTPEKFTHALLTSLIAKIVSKERYGVDADGNETEEGARARAALYGQHVTIKGIKGDVVEEE